MYTKPQADDIFSNLGMATALTTLILFWPIGRFSDFLPSKLAIPFNLLSVAIILITFLLISDPGSVISFFLWCILAIVFMF